MADDAYNVMGIDLGTTNSCVAIWKNGQVEVVPNDMGFRTTPSVVSFTKDDTIIGNAAQKKMFSNAKNTLFDSKRLIGHKVTDQVVVDDIPFWPFQVVSDMDGNPYMRIAQSATGKVEYSPQEVSAMILQYLKVQAENFAGRPINDVVITIPAYFDENQRKATEEAAKLANLNVLCILDEPSAAAIAYDFDQCNQVRKVLIYDLGGGTFDVSLLEVGNQCVHVLSSLGDNHLGGEDFNNNLMALLFQEYKKTMNEDISNNRAWIARMRRAAESCKIDLTAMSSSIVEFEGFDFTYSVSRYTFENLNRELFNRTIDIVKATLDQAGLTFSDVDDVVLVGGSTRIPRIQTMIKDLFPHARLCKNVNPDEAVAIGAAILAAMEKSSIIECMPTTSVLSLGIETHGGIVDTIIPRGSVLPVTCSYEYTIPTDYQEKVIFHIVQGERPQLANTMLLDVIVVDDLPLNLRENVVITITMLLSTSHQLHVEVLVSPKQILITRDISLDRDNPQSPLLLTPQALDELVMTAEQYKAADHEWIQQQRMRNELDCMIEEGYSLIHNPAPGMTNDWLAQTTRLLDSTRAWLRNNPDADSASCNVQMNALHQHLHSYNQGKGSGVTI